MSPAKKTCVAALGLAAASATVSWRVATHLNIPGQPHAPYYAMQDFRDVVYYPAVAFLDGANPYDSAHYLARYPAGQAMALYSPLLLLVDAPLATLPYRTAELVYYLCAVALTVALGVLALRLAGVRPTCARIAGLGAVLVVARPGHWNLFTGQVTLQVAIAAIIALWYAADRPWTAGLALAFTTIKPTYGLPLALLLLARGSWRPVVIGAVFAAVLTAIALTRVVSAAGGPSAFVSSIDATYAARERDPRRVELSPTRVDVVAGVARLIGRPPGIAATFALTLGVLGFAAVRLRRLDDIRDRDTRLHATSVGCLAVVACTYHQQYDLLMLTVPVAALVWRSDAIPWTGRPVLRRVALALAAVPLANFVASDSGVKLLGFDRRLLVAVASVDAVALLALLAIFGGVAVAAQPAGELPAGVAVDGDDRSTAPARSASRP